MKNLLLIFIEVIICYVSLIIITKKYKIDGLYVYGIIATFISCIMNLKQIELININIPLGLGVTTSIIIAGNLLTQISGKDKLKEYLLLITLTGIVSYILIYLSTIIKISDLNYYANKSYDNIFSYNLKISISLIISLLISIWLSSNLYYIIKRLKNKIIFSNILSVIITELFENIIFVLISFIFDYTPVDIFICILLRYIIKTIIAILGTIPIYIANKYNY